MRALLTVLCLALMTSPLLAQRWTAAFAAGGGASGAGPQPVLFARLRGPRRRWPRLLAARRYPARAVAPPHRGSHAGGERAVAPVDRRWCWCVHGASDRSDRGPRCRGQRDSLRSASRPVSTRRTAYAHHQRAYDAPPRGARRWLRSSHFDAHLVIHATDALRADAVSARGERPPVATYGTAVDVPPNCASPSSARSERERGVA